MTFVLFILLAAGGGAADPDVPAYACAATTRPVSVDGKLEEVAWAAAEWTADFATIAPDENDGPAKAPPRTRAKLLWDAKHLYVAAELADANVTAAMREHDSPLFREDAFELFLDPNDDAANYLELEINALNTTFDLLMSKPYRQKGRGNARFEITGLRTAAAIDGTLNDPRDRDRGWTVEIAIPWAALTDLEAPALPPDPGQRWRMNLARAFAPRGGEKRAPLAWSPIGRLDLHVPERWGWLTFVPAEAKAPRPK